MLAFAPIASPSYYGEANASAGHRSIPQTLRTFAHSQRWAGSASVRGCHSIETVKSFVGTGNANVKRPLRSVSVCRSGAVAMRSEPRASAKAAENPPTDT
jgi:hypothetical protein